MKIKLTGHERNILGVLRISLSVSLHTARKAFGHDSEKYTRALERLSSFCVQSSAGATVDVTNLVKEQNEATYGRLIQQVEFLPESQRDDFWQAVAMLAAEGYILMVPEENFYRITPSGLTLLRD